MQMLCIKTASMYRTDIHYDIKLKNNNNNNSEKKKNVSSKEGG